MQVGVEAGADETAQALVEMEETAQVQVEAEEKVQVPVETTEKADSEDAIPPTPPPTRPQMVSSSNGGSSLEGSGDSLLKQPVRYIPPRFLPLVQELEAIKARGSPAPKWCGLSSGVYKRLPSVLSEEGVK